VSDTEMSGGRPDGVSDRLVILQAPMKTPRPWNECE
jgi:hypothetical protein